MEPGAQRHPVQPSGVLAQAATRAQTLEDLSALLRDLRRRHARERRDSPLTYRELASRTGWSQAAIAEYLTGRTLPPTDRFDALAEVLGAGPAERGALADARDRVEENQRRSRTRAGRAAPPPPPAGPGIAEPPTPAPGHDGPGSGDPGSGSDVPGPDGPSTEGPGPGGPTERPGPERPEGPGPDGPDGPRSGAPGPAPAITPERAAHPAPRQLPAGTALFTGRDEDVARLLALAAHAPARNVPGAVVISAVDGMGGVGKSALAVHAAHRLAERFPDGQLFLDLYGFTQGKAPRDPGDALAALLGGLGVPPQRIPADVDARAALYRDRLSGTRTLVVLDNAADEDQVRPLLPAAGGCLVLITSRRRLTSLDDALPLSLDVLPVDAAVALLREASRHDTGPADESLWQQVAERCGRLPLALLIAAALLRTGGKAWDLRRLLHRLASRRSGDELAGYTDTGRSLAAVFDLSYRELSQRQRLLFRRLGLLPGPEIDAYAAAALLDADLDEADLLVQQLSDHSLLLGAAPGRYRVHDLIRAHARTLAAADPEDQREQARDRLFAYYQHTARRAGVLLDRVPRQGPGGPAPRHAPALPDEQSARTWLRVERAGLEGAFEQAHGRGMGAHTVALAAGLAQIMVTDGPWARALAVHETAAGHLGDRRGRAGALTDLGRVRRLTGDASGAADALGLALRLHAEVDEPLGRAGALVELVRVRHLTGDYAGAGEALAQALRLYRGLDNRHGQATVFAELGRVRYLTGEFTGAADALTRSLGLYRELGNRQGQATALSELGRVHSFVGDLAAAADALARALELNRELGNRQGQATALTDLGAVRRLAGDHTGAADALAQALQLYRDLGHRHGQALALAESGVVRRLAGDHTGAADALTRALRLYRELGHRGDEAWALNHYGTLLLAMGDRPRALALHLRALAVHRELSKPDDEAVSLEGIAECHLDAGDTVHGADRLRQALEIYRRLGMRPDADRVRARLADVTGSGRSS